jgi:hypothetical protein
VGDGQIQARKVQRSCRRPSIPTSYLGTGRGQWCDSSRLSRGKKGPGPALGLIPFIFSFFRTSAFTGRRNSPSLVGKMLVGQDVFPIVALTRILPQPLDLCSGAAWSLRASVFSIVKKSQAALLVLYIQSFVRVRDIKGVEGFLHAQVCNPHIFHVYFHGIVAYHVAYFARSHLWQTKVLFSPSSLSSHLGW